MAILNRILNIIVMLMAIAAVVFSFKLYDRRAELRGRGDLLAQTIQATAQRLDEKSPNSVAGDLTIQDKGAGKIGWMQYHADETAYRANLERFTTQANEVRAQRDNLGESIAKIGNTFKVIVNTGALNNPNEYEAEFAQVDKRTKEYYNRDNTLREKLVDHCKKINPDFDKVPGDLEPIDAYTDATAVVGQGIDRLNTLYERYSGAMVRIVKLLGQNRLGVSEDDVKEISDASVVTLLRGMNRVNDDLNHLALLQQQMKTLQEEIAKLKGDVEEANDTIQRQKAQIDTRDKNIVNLKNRIIDLQAMIDDLKGGADGKGHGQTEYDGQVVKVNYDYNYVIISHDEKDNKISYGVPLTVARDREYICRVKVTKIYKRYAVAEILNEEKVGDVLEGDRVVWLD